MTKWLSRLLATTSCVALASMQVQAQGVNFSQLPGASTLTGSEVVPIYQNGVAKRTSAAALANFASSFLPNATAIIQQLGLSPIATSGNASYLTGVLPLGVVPAFTSRDLSCSAGLSSCTVSSSQGVPFANVAFSHAYSDLSGTPSSLPPSGAANGDLGCSYPNPCVNKIGGQNIPNGLAKGNGTSLSAAVAGTDYVVPTGPADANTVAGQSLSLMLPPAAYNIQSFGAVPNANTAAATAANLAAFSRAFAAGPDVYCPSGQTYYVSGPVNIPTSARSLSGTCKIVAGAGFQDGQNVVTGNGNIGLRVSSVEADADLTAFPHSTGLAFGGETQLLLDRVRATAGFGIVDSGSTGTIISRPYVGDYNTVGIYTANENGIKIDAPEVHATKVYNSFGQFVSHCIQIGGGSQYGSVTNGSVYKCGYGFGVSIAGTAAQQSAYMTVANMHAFGTRIEGINFTDVQQFVEANNEVSFDGDTTDFGTSINADSTSSSYSGLLTGNKVSGSCKAGTALATNTVGVTVTGNRYTNVGSCVGRQASFTASVSASGLMTVTAVASGNIGWFDTVTGSGIPAGTTIAAFGPGATTTGTGNTGTYQLVYPQGSSPAAIASETITTAFSDTAHSNVAVLVYGGSNNNTIGPNYVSDFYNPAHLAYAQGELNDGAGDGGPPASNLFLHAAVNGSIGDTLMIGSGSKFASLTPWTSFTPVLSCSSGNLGSASASGNYQKVGTTVSINMHVAISTIGSCSGGLFATIPAVAAPAVQENLHGRDAGYGGYVLQGVIGAGSTSTSLLTYNNAFPGQTGSSMDLNDTYQTAQ